MESDLERARRLREVMGTLPIGYGPVGTPFSMLIGPSPLLASSAEVAVLRSQARLIRTFLEKSLDFYTQGINGQPWSWFTRLVDGASSDQLREISHRCALALGVRRVPLFARADQMDFGRSAELQIPGSGWGCFEAISSAMQDFTGKPIGASFARGFSDALLRVCNSGQIRVVHANNQTGFTPERIYFAQRVTEVSGGKVQMQLSQPWKLDSHSMDVLRRCFLSELIQFAGFSDIFEAYLHSSLEIEPMPCLLYDQKVSAILPFDPRSRKFYTDEERDLFPETYLVSPEYIPSLDLGLTSWLELANFPAGKRRWILKYAGPDPSRRGSATQVWNLEDESRERIRQLINAALVDCQGGQHWIIQRKVKRKFSVTYLGLDDALHTDAMYARVNPMFYLGSGREDVLGVVASLRPYWKVHAIASREGSPSVFLAVHESGET